MLEMSDWPGRLVEPVWNLLEPVESARPLRRYISEPAADKPEALAVLAADLPDEAFAEASAFVRNALHRYVELIANEFLPRFTEKGHFGRDMVASMREAMTWPGMEATEQLPDGQGASRGRRVGASSAASADGVMAGLMDGRAFLGTHF